MIEDGKNTIRNAGQIVDADGGASLPTISDSGIEDGADDQGPLSVRFPSPESNSSGLETRRNALPPKRESNRDQAEAPATPVQFPFTRSNFSQHLEKSQKSANWQANSRACSTRVSYLNASKSSPTLSNRGINRRRDCSTRSSHQPSARGLWLRGSIYQFRVKVPVDLRDALGCVHVNRSLRTDSPSLAVRLARKAAFEIDAMFEAKRRQIGLDYDVRLIADQESMTTVRRTIGPRSGSASTTVDPAGVDQSDVPMLTLSTIYERFLNDPTKRRAARTMLAHHTTRRVIEDDLSEIG